MPRQRTEIGARAEKKLTDLLARGGTAKSIAAALRAAGVKGISERTIGRRLKELRGAQHTVHPARGSKADGAKELREEYAAAAAAAGDAAGAESDDGRDLPNPDAIPTDADLTTITNWMKRADTLGKAAFERGDLEGMGKMGRLTSALLEAKRKATPLDKEDPNDSPDMQKLGAEVEIRLLKMIDELGTR